MEICTTDIYPSTLHRACILDANVTVKMSFGKGVYMYVSVICLCLLLFAMDNCYCAGKRTKNKKKGSATHLWTTQIDIRVNQTSRDVAFRFRLAPKKYKFEEYSLLLEYANRTPVKEWPYKPSTDELKIRQASQVIEQLSPGEYAILIRPVDDRKGDPINCKCKEENGACTSCSATYSDVFSVNNYQTDAIVVPGPGKKIPDTVNHWNTSTIILIVGVALLALALVALLGYVKFNKTRRRPTEGSDIIPRVDQPNNVDEIDMKDLPTPGVSNISSEKRLQDAKSLGHHNVEFDVFPPVPV